LAFCPLEGVFLFFKEKTLCEELSLEDPLETDAFEEGDVVVNAESLTSSFCCLSCSAFFLLKGF